MQAALSPIRSSRAGMSPPQMFLSPIQNVIPTIRSQVIGIPSRVVEKDEDHDKCKEEISEWKKKYY